MAFLSFTTEKAVESAENQGREAKKLLEVGYYNGKIMETKTIVSAYRNKDGDEVSEDVFVIAWHTKDKTIDQKFRLWNEEEKTRISAKNKLTNLLTLLRIKLFSQDSKMEFDTDALIEREARLFVNHFTNKLGKTYDYVESFEEIQKDVVPPITNDEIGF